MTFTTTQLTALEAAIATGALQVQYADRRVIYHSLAEMIKVRDTLRSELGISTPAAGRTRLINLKTGKGL